VDTNGFPELNGFGREEGGSSTKLGRGARILRGAILRGDLKPGQKLKQQELAEWLGMSATPVREVLRILETEGLLEHIPHKGVYVAAVSPQDTEEITPIRVALETLAVNMFATRLNEDDLKILDDLVDQMEQAWEAMDLARVRRANYYFHSRIYSGAGSEILRGFIERLWPRFATDMLWMIPGRTEQSIEQHRAIVEALRGRDGERAAQLMAEHITTAGERIVRFSSQQSGSLDLAGPED